MIIFNDLLFNNEEVTVEKCDVKNIFPGSYEGRDVVYIENVDGLIFACDKYTEL